MLVDGRLAATNVDGVADDIMAGTVSGDPLASEHAGERKELPIVIGRVVPKVGAHEVVHALLAKGEPSA